MKLVNPVSFLVEHHVLLALKNTGQSFSPTLAGHFKQQNRQQKSIKMQKSMALKSSPKGHLFETVGNQKAVDHLIRTQLETGTSEDLNVCWHVREYAKAL